MRYAAIFIFALLLALPSTTLAQEKKPEHPHWWVIEYGANAAKWFQKASENYAAWRKKLQALPQHQRSLGFDNFLYKNKIYFAKVAIDVKAFVEKAKVSTNLSKEEVEKQYYQQFYQPARKLILQSANFYYLCGVYRFYRSTLENSEREFHHKILLEGKWIHKDNQKSQIVFHYPIRRAVRRMKNMPILWMSKGWRILTKKLQKDVVERELEMVKLQVLYKHSNNKEDFKWKVDFSQDRYKLALNCQQAMK